MATRLSPLVSIIIPMRNTPYELFDACVRSALRQTYDNLEIIIVDDGSEECAAVKCDRLAQLSSKIKVLHQAPSGVSCARNAGIYASQGKWLCFLDADDELYPECIQSAVHHGELYSADIVFGRIADSFSTRCEPAAEWGFSEGCRVFSKASSLYAMAQHIMSSLDLKNCDIPHGVQIGPCAKLYNRESIGDIRFREDLFISEDRFFTCEILNRSERIACCDELWYKINHHSKSTTQQFDVKHWISGLCATASAEAGYLQNANEVGCCMQAMMVIDALQEKNGTHARSLIRELARNPLIGWQAKPDYSTFILSRPRRLMIWLGEHNFLHAYYCMTVLRFCKKRIRKTINSVIG